MNRRLAHAPPSLRQRGIALVFVLWAGLLVAAISLGLSITAGADLSANSGAVERLRVEAAADAGIRAGIAGILGRRGVAALLPRRLEFELAGVTTVVDVASEYGRVDLNAAPAALVRALADVVTEGEGRALAEAWLARRAGEEPTAPIAPEAEIEFEFEAEAEVEPQTGAFMVTRELLDLPGVDAAVYQRLRAMTTVHSRQPGVDPLSAARDVLLALPGATPALVDELIAEREALSAETGGRAVVTFIATVRSRLPEAAALLFNRRPVVFTVTSVARLPGGAEVVREAVVSLRRSPGQLYSVLEWGEGSGLVARTAEAPAS